MTISTICRCGQIASPGHQCDRTQARAQHDQQRRQNRVKANGYNHAAYKRNRRRLLNSQHECELCGSETRLSAHHRTPVALGGSHNLDNLMVVCARCHGRIDGGRRYASA